MKQALIVAFLGIVRDRFTQMGEPLHIREKLRIAALIPDVRGVEIIFPDECSDPVAVLEALAETGLELAAVNVNLKGRLEFQRGALNVADPTIRKLAIASIVQAKEFALKVGAARVTCAPLADGVDYSLQQDYATAWIRAVETLRTAMQEGPPLPVHLEHKPSDPRVRGLLSSPEIVLRLLADIGCELGGITFNVGHASLDGLSPAASLAHVLHSAVPLYVHLCDAAGGWDWDVLPGSYHHWNFLEVLEALSASGYAGWLTSDTFPLRQQAQSLCTAHVNRTALALKAIRSRCPRFPKDAPGYTWKEVEAWSFPTK